MNVKMRNYKLALVAVATLVFANAVIAQEPETPEQPKPAGRGIPAIDDSTAQDQNTDSLAEWNPDTMPITGLQTPTIGFPESRHSYLVPGLQYGSSLLDQPNGGGNSAGWYSYNFFGANLSLLQQWSRSSQLALNYSVGGYVSDAPGQSNGWYQDLALSQNFLWRRWQMQILDQFAYLPQSQFGFGGGTGLGLPGIGGPLAPSIPGISISVLPNQSNYAANGPQYYNSFVTQITYQTSQRGSITMAGSFGLLRFTQAGVDSNLYSGSVGYNYMLTKEDSVGLFYRFTAYHYPGEPQAFGDQAINMVYVRKVTKRVALQIYGGPDITSYRIPEGGQSQTVAGDAGVNLTYAFQKGAVSASYLHGIVGGSGILIGSSADQLSLSATRRVTRVWSAQGNFGFGQNRPLGNGVGVQGTDFNSIYVGGGLSRPIGKNANVSIAYQAQIQPGNATICTGSACNTSHTLNIVTINFQWHTRPFVLE